MAVLLAISDTIIQDALMAPTIDTMGWQATTLIPTLAAAIPIQDLASVETMAIIITIITTILLGALAATQASAMAVALAVAASEAVVLVAVASEVAVDAQAAVASEEEDNEFFKNKCFNKRRL